jgi:AraC-like DNA-binding protein
LRGSGLRIDDVRGETTAVLAEQELAVIRNLVRLLGDRPGLGVEAGRLVNLGNLGIFVFALLASATLADALAVATRFAHLTNAYADLSLAHEAAEMWLVCGFDDLDTEVRSFVVERDLTVIAGLVPMVLGNAVLPRIEVEVGADRVPYLAAVFTAERVVCDAARTALIMPESWASRRLPHADAETARRCIDQCEKLLATRHLGIRSLVWSRLSDGDAPVRSLGELAAELHIDRRTLQRRLAREGTSFRTLLDEARRMRAEELLTTTDCSIDHVAAALGYAERATFIHAFTRWHGTTPSRFRALRR